LGFENGQHKNLIIPSLLILILFKAISWGFAKRGLLWDARNPYVYFIVCLQAKKSKNAFFGDFRPPVENAHSIGTFHMFPDSISLFGFSEKGKK